MGFDDIGVKVSQIGWDINKAGDANLYFSSSWPLLKIEKTDVVSVGSVVNHSLQYPPFALAWNPIDGLTICKANSKTITIPTSPSSTTSRYFIFRLPLNKSYQSPIVRAPLQPSQNADHNFGIKCAKEGKNNNSHDYRDYTIHSSLRSPTLHAVLFEALTTLPATGGQFSMRWKPDLPYNPVYFAFFSTDKENFTPLSTIAQQPPKVWVGNYTTDGSIFIANGGTKGYGTLVILKDPLDSVYKIEVKL
jgi:hypothetical protein